MAAAGEIQTSQIGQNAPVGNDARILSHRLRASEESWDDMLTVSTRRHVFFSFHYRGDSWRVGQVRNSWLTKGKSASTFLDAAEWEAVERRGNAAIEGWINRQLKGTSVTVVLIGTRTASRPYVKFEIEQSIAKGNALVGVRIHQIKDRHGKTSNIGANPMDDHMVRSTGISSFIFERVRASTRFKTYDWVDDNGYRNIEDWIEEAAIEATRAPLR